MNEIFPNKILLQWHITDRCNYQCSHCYQNRYDGAECDLPALKGILVQFKELLGMVAERAGKQAVKGHITVTGGEPFVRGDFPDLLELLAAAKEWTSFGILSNGSMIDSSLAEKLKDLRTSFVQISIEGKSLDP